MSVDLFSPTLSSSVGGSTIILDSEEDDLPKSVYVKSNKRKFLEYDEDSDIPDDTDVAAPASACSSYKKIKSELPEVVAKKNTEKPLPHPFPFPSNYRPEVEICLKNKRMTKEARKHFHSSVASAMFSYKRSSCYLVYYGQGWGDGHWDIPLSLILCISSSIWLVPFGNVISYQIVKEPGGACP